MKGRPSFISATGILAAVVLLAGVALWVLLSGQGLFSPGPLNAEARGQTLGGVRSHAELGDDCDACHPAPWSGETMGAACVECHTSVAAELDAREGLHGGLAGGLAGLACGPCHPEHNGPDAALTVIDKAAFRSAHESTGFSLATHEKTAQGESFACADCHPDGYDRFDQRICSACHRELDAAFMGPHEAAYDADCLACHDGGGRIGEDFDHSATRFPLVGRHADVECRSCHEGATTAADLEQTPTSCASCHAGDDAHDGAYGTGCGSCHTAAAWDDVTFDHSVFPLDHGSEERDATCETCHPDVTSTYTCYGCHAHTVANVLDEHEGRPLTKLRDCARCHPGGREAEDD